MYGKDKSNIHYGIGSDLTDWINNKAALVAGELQAFDKLRGNAFIGETDAIYQDGNTGYLADKILTGRVEGRVTFPLHLQTGIFCYITSGVCTTVEATPNTHTMTLTPANLTTAPINFAIHAEKETAGGNIEKRVDLMGLNNPALNIYVSERKGETVAQQNFSCNFAYANPEAGNLGVTSELSVGAHKPYGWFHLAGSGSKTFTFGGTDIAVRIVSINIKLNWMGYEFSNFDEYGYPTDGRYIPKFQWEVKLGIRPYDHATNVSIWSIKDDVLAGDPPAYAGGDLDFEAYFYDTASRELKFTFDKLYLDPNFEVMVPGDNSWYDGYEITLTALNTGSSLVVYEENALNNDYYENP